MHPAGDWLNRPGGLAERLYGMRKAAGLTGEQIAASLGWPRSKVSKLENGRQMPSADDVRAWAAETGRADAEADLLDLLATARAVYRQHRNRSHADLQRDVDLLVRQAARIRSFEPVVIPGLLATPDYARARAAEVAWVYGTGEDGIEATVAAWMRRQEVLYDCGHTFEFILTEAALRFRLAPAPVIAGQLDRLMSLAGLANVTLSIIPFSAELQVTPLHGFLIADDVTYLETFTTDDAHPADVTAIYQKIADALAGAAVTGDQARQLVAAAAAALEQET